MNTVPKAHSEKQQRQRIIEAIQAIESYADKTRQAEGDPKRQAAEGLVEALYALHGLTEDEDLAEVMNNLEKLLEGPAEDSEIDALVDRAAEVADTQHPRR